MTDYKGYYAPIEQNTVDNTMFRNVVYTGRYAQLVLMSLAPGEDIGAEQHGVDQFFRIESGTGQVRVDNQLYDVQDGDCVIAPAGAIHNVTNTSQIEALKLYTIYSIPNHVDGEKFQTKADAGQEDRPFNGVATEN